MANNKLKVGFVIDDGLDRPDGVQQYVLTIGNWLQSKGHEVRYLAGETKRDDISGVYSLTRNASVNFSGNRLTTPLPASKRNISQILAHEKFDILHVQMPYSPFCAARVVKLANKKTAIVGTFHILPYNFLGRAGSWLLGRVLWRNIKRFDHFFSVSEPAQQFARESFSINAELLPNTVDLAKFMPRSPLNSNPNKKLKLLYVGRLVPRKGCLELLKAIKIVHRISNQKNKFNLDICGDGPKRAELERYVKSQKLEKVVTFHGFVSDEQKIDFMQQADIAIFPAYSGESFGIVLIEAMAAGSGVVIGGDNPGYRSVLNGMTECIVDPKNSNGFARTLLKFLNESELRTKFHIKQQNHVKQFGVETVGRKLLMIYKDCIEARKS